MTDPSGSAAAEKERLRARMRAARAAIPASQRASLAERVEDRLFALPEVAGAATVLLFASFGTEVPTHRMIRRLLAEGRTVLLPYVRDEEMRAAPLLPGSLLIETGYGPMEPSDPYVVDSRSIDVVVVPGLGFGRDGTRVGYGRGHYDRFLAAARPSLVRVGIGFAVQLVDTVAAGASDERLDYVVTDRETVRCPVRAAGKGSSTES